MLQFDESIQPVQADPPQAGLRLSVADRGAGGETAMPKTEHYLADAGSFVASRDDLHSKDPLHYPDYNSSIARAQARSHSDESVRTGRATIGGHEVELAIFEFQFMGGSMGEVAGERVARAMERAAKRGVPFVMRASSGGARMQEGMRSLVQMPKVICARLELAESHQPFIAVLGNPTTGGVLISVAALADVTVAEAGATIGFAGPRVVERFTGKKLEQDSHTARSALIHGLVDAVVEPKDASNYVINVLDLLEKDLPGQPPMLPPDSPAIPPQTSEMPPQTAEKPMDPWEAVQAARDCARLRGPQLVKGMSDLLIPLRGDRAGGDDLGVSANLARVDGRRIMVLALDRKYAAVPSGFRKARRCLEIAARLRLPVVTIVDTRGANPSEISEAGGIAWEMAAMFKTMLEIPVPILSILTGEGGSGGAMAFATADRLIAYEDSIFSVIGPESAAEILWRDGDRAPDAARLLKLTSYDLLDFGLADVLVTEPLTADSMRRLVAYHLNQMCDLGKSPEDWRASRRNRWRRKEK